MNRKLSTYGERRPFPLSNGCALSLLSSKDSWISSGDLPARCSAALRELIAENRAAILARQLILDKDWQWHHHHHHHPTEDLNGRQDGVSYQHQMGTGSHGWDRISEAGGGHVTLDLMQAPNSAFGFLSVQRNSKEDGECPDLCGSFGGAHVV